MPFLIPPVDERSDLRGMAMAKSAKAKNRFASYLPSIGCALLCLCRMRAVIGAQFGHHLELPTNPYHHC